ncbi:ADP-ribosylglycohydrolase family protein [Acaricomes phytoseiuli]|uniref:ADP-ribosylglycohydrolase family protein n=1 Tax=Acaricomes phytoseiuli TaxID=291968 RepID=UPI0022230C7F|nr:ADP-ribosylglycohydrolase family protein [Acaricomes phytoseiuli]MCW1250232.1 ADP-ribosylglycohydrolase family protein [Acaricomes phytoseiuli]
MFVAASTVSGTLLGGALGDAFGAPLENQDLAGIRHRYGSAGLQEPGDAGLPAHFSDDTQLTLYTADALTELLEWARQGVSADPAATVWLAYLRWLRSQGEDLPETAPQPLPRDIDRIPALRYRRNPGKACLESLRTGEMGTRNRPLLPQAKGSGSLMRSAPFGLVPFFDETIIASLSSDAAVLTHGHPSTWQASAGFSLLIHWLAADRRPLREAVADLKQYFLKAQAVPELQSRVSRAVELADQTLAEGTAIPAATLRDELGPGWLAEEALPLALYAVLASESTGKVEAAGKVLEKKEASTGSQESLPESADHFRRAIRLAANDADDSDTVAALAGNILGAYYGRPGLPEDWIDALDSEEAAAVVLVASAFAEVVSTPAS